MSRYHSVPVKLLGLEAEIGRPVDHEAIELHEAAFVEQELQPLTGGELALLVLCLEPRFAATQLGLAAPPLQEVELLSHCH